MYTVQKYPKVEIKLDENLKEFKILIKFKFTVCTFLDPQLLLFFICYSVLPPSSGLHSIVNIDHNIQIYIFAMNYAMPNNNNSFPDFLFLPKVKLTGFL